MKFGFGIVYMFVNKVIVVFKDGEIVEIVFLGFVILLMMGKIDIYFVVLLLKFGVLCGFVIFKVVDCVFVDVMIKVFFVGGEE